MSGRLREEEEIAQEALERIQRWMKQESPSEPKGLWPRLAIKYCGGCNPEVERGEIARILRQALGSEISWSLPEEQTELLLLIQGCATACANRPDVTQKAEAVLQVEGKRVSSIQRKHLPLSKES